MSLAIGAMASPAVDPDAQATITDFLDYTEYFPSDLIRSLTLIRGLDTAYQNNAHAVHDLTKIYGALPTLPPSIRPDPAALRQQISFHLDRAIDVRENAYAEATRAVEASSRNTNRIQSIVSKLKSLPKPPSRDPTPQPISSPDIKRSRSGRKIENSLAPRLTLNPPRYPAAVAGQKRKRQLIIPGEPLPAFDPDSPIGSTEQSDEETDHISPTQMNDATVKTLKLKAPKESKTPTRGPRSASAMMPKPQPPPADAVRGSEHRPWTRITAYERFRLQKAMKKGSEWEPPHTLIKRLLLHDGRGTEAFEEAKAVAERDGVPLLDCDEATRGTARPPPPATPMTPALTATPNPTPNREALLAAAARDSQTPSQATTQATPQGTIVVESKNKKATETKKSKRPSIAPAPIPDPVVEAAAKRTTLDLQSAAQGLNNLSRLLNGVFRPPTPIVAPSPQPPKKKQRKTISRTNSANILSEQTSPAVSVPKETKAEVDFKPPSLTPTMSAPASTISAAPANLKITLSTEAAAPSSELSSPLSPKAPSRASSRIASRQASVVPKTGATPTPPLESRQSSVRPPSRQSVAATVEPTPAAVTRALRRNSTPASNVRKTPKPTASPKAADTTAAGRRSKRPQGAVAQNNEDGAAIIKTGRRQGNKPGPGTKIKLQTGSGEVNTTPSPAQYIRTDVDGRVEVIPDDEPRYCICDDVSYGDMIACDHGVPKDGCPEWFHMACVGLHDMPGRTVKWYCPNCRVKLHKGENSNGLVGRIVGRA